MRNTVLATSLEHARVVDVGVDVPDVFFTLRPESAERVLSRKHRSERAHGSEESEGGYAAFPAPDEDCHN